MNKNGNSTQGTWQKENKNDRMILKKLRARGEKYSNMLQDIWIKEKEQSDSEVSETSFSSIMGSIYSIEPEDVLVQTDLE